MELNIAVCDDDDQVVSDEVQIIEKVLTKENVAAKIDSFNSPDKLLMSENVYNIVFLDIEMNGTNGIKVAEKIRMRNENCLFFFVTNHEKYIDDAGDQRAFRFWIKPMDEDRVRCGLASARREIDRAKQFITVTVHCEDIQIFINNIVNVFVLNKRVYITTVKGELAVDTKYKQLYEQLKRYSIFFETTRGCCVNFVYVTDYDKDKVYSTYNETRIETYLSRRKREVFIKAFMDWLGDK